MVSTQGPAPPPPLYPTYLPVRPEGPSASIPHPPFEAEEPALRADPTKPTISGHEGLKYKNLTPRIGTELRGIQLSQLDAKGLDEVALLAAERGVLVFVSSHDHGRIGIRTNHMFCFPERPRLRGYWYGETKTACKVLALRTLFTNLT